MEENFNPQILSPEETQEVYYEMAKNHPKDIFELLVKAEAEVALCTPDEDYGGDTIALVTAQFGEKKMSVLHDYTHPFTNTTEVLYNIDVKAVMDALQVNSYSDALIAFKDRFSGINACCQIERFLRSNKIRYEYASESTEYDEEGNPL